MDTKIIFNGKTLKDSKESFLDIVRQLTEDTKISGSMGTENNYYVFSNVNKETFMYYVNEFNKLKKNTKKEVKFVIQTHDGKARSLQ